MHVYSVIAIQTCLLLFLQFGDQILLSNFAARKACHAGSGLLMLLLRSEELEARCVHPIICAGSLLDAFSWPYLTSLPDQTTPGP